MFATFRCRYSAGEIADNPLNYRPIVGFPHSLIHGTPFADTVVCGAMP